MKKTVTLILAALCVLSVSAQDKCFFPTRKGAELTYKYYTPRGTALKDDWKKERWLKFTVEQTWPEESGMIINVGVANQSLERLAGMKSTEIVAQDLSYGDVKVKDGVVSIDNMQWLIDGLPEFFTYLSDDEQMPKFRVELVATSTFPVEMKVGDELPDEEIFNAKYLEVLSEEEREKRKKQMEEARERMKEFEMEARAMGYGDVGSRMLSGDEGMTFTVKAKTRKRRVEAIENVETPAGTFECYKISYELVEPDSGSGFVVMHFSGGFGPMMPPGGQEEEGVKYADWISPEVGLVKREKYNSRGKVQEVMRLESYKK